MAPAHRKNLDQPDEVVPFDHGRAELVQVGEWTVGRTVQLPGWRWSEHVKPIVGTDLCRAHHLALQISGRLHVRMEDGSELEFGPGDVCDIPPGHDAWTVGDEPSVTFDFGGLRNWLPSRLTAGERVLTTMLFTDVVGSTAHLERLGDRAWKALLEQHDERVRAALATWRGQIVKTTGDGILATFDGPARAVRCAAAIRDRVAELGIAIRAGVHTGEVELADGDLRGIAVHEAARVMALAGANEVFVSGTTRDLVAGSGLALEERGSHELKGISGRRTVYAFAG